jgi:hypothetical protein
VFEKMVAALAVTISDLFDDGYCSSAALVKYLKKLGPI